MVIPLAKLQYVARFQFPRPAITHFDLRGAGRLGDIFCTLKLIDRPSTEEGSFLGAVNSRFCPRYVASDKYTRADDNTRLGHRKNSIY